MLARSFQRRSHRPVAQPSICMPVRGAHAHTHPSPSERLPRSRLPPRPPPLPARPRPPPYSYASAFAQSCIPPRSGGGDASCSSQSAKARAGRGPVPSPRASADPVAHGRRARRSGAVRLTRDARMCLSCFSSPPTSPTPTHHVAMANGNAEWWSSMVVISCKRRFQNEMHLWSTYHILFMNKCVQNSEAAGYRLKSAAGRTFILGCSPLVVDVVFGGVQHLKKIGIV